MSWAKIDDGLPDHPKIAQAGAEAAWLFVSGLCYCSRYMTDGFIPMRQVPRLADVDANRAAAKLVEVKLWHVVEGGFQVHDYLDYQASRDKRNQEKEAAARRQSDFRNRRNDVNNGVTHNVTSPVTGSVTHAVDNGVTNGAPARAEKEIELEKDSALPEDYKQHSLQAAAATRACPREAAAPLPPPPLDDLLHSLGGKGFTAAEIERARSEVLSRVPPPIVTNWAHYLEPRLLENRQRDARPVTAPAIRDPNSLAVRTSKRRFDDQ